MSASVAFASPPLSLASAPLRVTVAHDTCANSAIAVMAPRPPRRRVSRVVQSDTVRTRRAASRPPAVRVQGASAPEGVAADKRASVRTRQSKRSARGKSADRATQRAPHVALEREGRNNTFLEQQLQLRQKEKENSARKHAAASKSRRTQKRMRSPLRRTRNVSNSLKDTFQMYMEEISRSDLLGQAQVIELAAHIKHSVAVEEQQRLLEAQLQRRPSVDELAQHLRLESADVRRIILRGTAAKNALVSANLRLVTSVARKVASAKTGGGGLALDDMVQEGSVGLIRAAEKFDASRGYRFSTYATWWIRAYVMRCITTQSRSIKVPSTIVDEYARIRKEYTRLREVGVTGPSEEQVARALGITAAKLRFVVNVVTRKPVSLDLTLGPASDPSGSRSLGEIVEGDDHVEERLVQTFQRQELDLALRQCLRPLERAVIRLRFGLEDGQPRTLRETGELLGLSKERIRQLIFRALPKMKTPEIQRMLTDAASR